MAAPIIDETHDPKLESWVESANDAGTDFPIQNLPFCAFRRHDEAGSWASEAGLTDLGVRIGDRVLCIETCDAAMLFSEEITDLGLGWLGDVAAISPAARRSLRRQVSHLLAKGNTAFQSNKRLRESALLSVDDVEIVVPDILVHDYTDFYASIHHATNVGSMFRPDNPILPNYRHIPIGYHGRASSIVASGVEVRRPSGQQAPSEEGGGPSFGPCKLLDYEMELGFFVSQGNALGQPISIEEAEEHLFGMCIVNDWSARDLQKWEYQPLGPFLAKSFATSISPYVVTMEALAPFRTPAFARPEGDPSPLPYLTSDDNTKHGGVDITVEVYLASKQMRDKGMDPVRLSHGNFNQMYWTIAQMLTHHASNGCNLQAGDLMASGTISGPNRENRGCLLELTWDGDATNPVPGTQRTPITLPTGEERKFLADGDEVIMKAYCEREGYRRIGFGECRGVVAPAL